MPRKKKTQTELATAADMLINGAYTPMLVDGVAEKGTALAATYSRKETNEAPLQSYPNLENFIAPFRTSGASRFVDTREAVRLSVRAYWAFPLLRNVVEVMGELANSELYLNGGNTATNDFLKAWFDRIGMWQLKEQFFREWFRSGNCFFYRFDGEFSPSDLKKMTQIYGALGTKTIPLKYTILNPEAITAVANLTFDKPIYYKTLSSYEMSRIQNPQTAEDKAFLAQLDGPSKKAIQEGINGQMPLDPDKLSVLLYKAQPYEPMGVPMAYGVLKDIEAKLELKRLDVSMARTTDRALLLLTVGETPTQFHKGGSNINHNTIAALQAAFANEGVARTLIADYTVKGEWKIPDLSKILGAEKYTQLDKDINAGLNAILFNEGEKFANTSLKVQIFVERLKEARNAFLNNFLRPEIARVCKSMNAKSVPEVDFAELDLKDELEYNKIYLQLATLGLLTPEELFEAMRSGKMPTINESLASQKVYKDNREAGYYLPLIGGAAEIQKQQLAIQGQQVDNTFELGKQSNDIAKQGNAIKAAQPLASGPAKPKGRPKGSKAPKSSSKPSPMQKSKAAMEGYSLAEFKDLVPAVSEVHNQVEKALRKQFSIKRLTESQTAIGKSIVESIISNEPQEAWADSVASYLKEPKEIDGAIASEIDEIRIKHDVDAYTAAILRLTKTTIEDDGTEEPNLD